MRTEVNTQVVTSYVSETMDRLFTTFRVRFRNYMSISIRSSDRGNAYDEDDYETSIFIKYLKEVESIKDDIYERQYTLKYYLERLSATYNYQDPDT